MSRRLGERAERNPADVATTSTRTCPGLHARLVPVRCGGSARRGPGGRSIIGGVVVSLVALSVAVPLIAVTFLLAVLLDAALYGVVGALVAFPLPAAGLLPARGPVPRTSTTPTPPDTTPS